MNGVDEPRQRVLSAYLMGCMNHVALAELQNRLMYEVSGDPASTGAVILCDHTPQLSLGRSGCRLQIGYSDEQLQAMQLHVHYLGRGGGLWLQTSGQVTGYIVLELSALRLTPGEYVRKLCFCLQQTIRYFVPLAKVDDRTPGVMIGSRRVAQVGVSVRRGVTSYGFVINVRPDLELWRTLACDGDEFAMTSIQRESNGLVREAAVRERFLFEFSKVFQFSETVLIHQPKWYQRTNLNYASIVNPIV